LRFSLYINIRTYTYEDAIMNGTNQASQKIQRGECGYANIYTVGEIKAQLLTHSQSHRTHFYNTIRMHMGLPIVFDVQG